MSPYLTKLRRDGLATGSASIPLDADHRFTLWQPRAVDLDEWSDGFDDGGVPYAVAYAPGRGWAIWKHRCDKASNGEFCCGATQ